MKRNAGSFAAAVLLAVCMSLVTGCAPKRNFAGTWNGSVAIKAPVTGQPMTLPLVFHVMRKDDGTYTSTLDVTTVKMTGLPVQSFVVDGDKVTFAIQTAIGGYKFSGTTNADATEISGNMAQDSNSTPLKLTKMPDAK